MKTFGELVTQIKRGLLELCNDLMGPGAAQALGPAHAYGKSFLIYQSFRNLQDANQNQENHLKALVAKEGNSGSIQNNDTKLWRVVDSIFQSISLINRYISDPTRYTHQGIAEWIKQEATKCGLNSEFISVDDSEELDISGQSFTLELKLENQDTVKQATLHRFPNAGNMENTSIDVPELLQFLEEDKRLHISHLLSMAARLDIIENEIMGQSLTQLVEGLDIPFKQSLGGLMFPFSEGYDALLTLDTFEQDRRLPMLIIDPPIAFPYQQLRDIQMKCGTRTTVEFSVISYFSLMLKLQKGPIRAVGDTPVRLLLRDDKVPSIMLARLPVRNNQVLPEVISILKKAAIFNKIIIDAFSQSEQMESLISINIAPSNDFKLAFTYWVQDFPSVITAEIDDNGKLFTDNEEINESFEGEEVTIFGIIKRLISS